MVEPQTVSSIGKSIEVDREFQVMAHFELGVKICPNIVAFLLGGLDK